MRAQECVTWGPLRVFFSTQLNLERPRGGGEARERRAVRGDQRREFAACGKLADAAHGDQHEPGVLVCRRVRATPLKRKGVSRQ